MLIDGRLWSSISHAGVAQKTLHQNLFWRRFGTISFLGRLWTVDTTVSLLLTAWCLTQWFYIDSTSGIKPRWTSRKLFTTGGCTVRSERIWYLNVSARPSWYRHVPCVVPVTPSRRCSTFLVRPEFLTLNDSLLRAALPTDVIMACFSLVHVDFISQKE